MTAPAFEALLAVQERDSAIDRLRHRRATLEERQALARLDAEASARASLLAAAAGRRDEAAGVEGALEAELATTEARIAEINKRMYSGTVSASRELQAMSEEVAHLKERVGDLEEKALESMEVREPLEAEVAKLEAEDAAAGAEADRLRVAAAEADAAIDAELASEQAERQRLAALVPADLLAEYEQLRGKLGGTGAAKLVGNQCTGCHLALSATEVARLRREPDDALEHCDNCGPILVRSGAPRHGRADDLPVTARCPGR